jgi:hypothetical protein
MRSTRKAVRGGEQQFADVCDFDGRCCGVQVQAEEREAVGIGAHRPCLCLCASQYIELKMCFKCCDCHNLVLSIVSSSPHPADQRPSTGISLAEELEDKPPVFTLSNGPAVAAHDREHSCEQIHLWLQQHDTSLLIASLWSTRCSCPTWPCHVPTNQRVAHGLPAVAIGILRMTVRDCCQSITRGCSIEACDGCFLEQGGGV